MNVVILYHLASKTWCFMRKGGAYNMRKRNMTSVLELIAEDNGYKDKTELLKDYSFIPTVMTPKHKKIEFALLVFKHLTNR